MRALCTGAMIAALAMWAPALVDARALDGPLAPRLEPRTKGAAEAATAPDTTTHAQIPIDRVVAIVDRDVVLESELMRRVGPLSAELEQIADEHERQRRQKALAARVLDEMVNEHLMLAAARDAKLEVAAKEVANAIEEIKRQNNVDDEGLAKALEMQGYTLAAYRQDVRRQILRMRAVNVLVRPRVTITDEDVRAAYDARGRRAGAVTRVHLRHILLSLPEHPSEQQLAAAKRRAADIIDRVRGGAKFEDIAAKTSDDDATAAAGGDLGWIERGSIATEWEAIVFGMDKGEVRGPISGPSGLHVFYVSELEKAEQKPFEEAKDQLRNDLYRREMDKQTKLWLDDLRRKAHIELKL